jgi:hypothetical protein
MPTSLTHRLPPLKSTERHTRLRDGIFGALLTLTPPLISAHGPSRLSAPFTASAHAQGWEVLRQEEGVVVSMRAEPGRELPSFKGVGRVKSNMYHLLAILSDGTRRREWMTRSGVTRVLKRVSDSEGISYQQTLAPWPVSDRDVVMHTRIYRREAPLEIVATFDGEVWKEKIAGVDRGDFIEMSYLKGYWRLVYISDQETDVTYMVNTHPGGSLPDWLIRRITRDLPFYTITGMRDQAKKTAGQYTDFLRQFDPKFEPSSPKVPLTAPPSAVVEYMK